MQNDDSPAAATPPVPAGSAEPQARDEPSFKRLLLLSAICVLVAGGLLFWLSRMWGTPVLSAGYIGLMFLAPAVRILNLKGMVAATGWAMAILVLGVLIGTFGPWVQLGGVVLTALGQGLFVVSGSAGLNRSPASLVGFSKFAETGSPAEVWQPLIGLSIGAAAIIILGLIAFGSGKKTVKAAPLSERLFYGGGLAIGSAVLTVIWTVAGLGGLGYALLVFCLVYAFDSGKVIHNSRIRVFGAILGVVTSVLVSWLLSSWQPALIAVFMICGILALASLLNKQEFWFVVFLVAAVVHLAEITPGKSAWDSGVEHIFGVLGAAAVAVALHCVAVPLHNRILKPAIAAHTA
ncbi:FUSC family protein [Gordonia sp. PP30]|uniref:FUSC family protein n=1 Tax=Gordonia sp. PP30 TaxID=2935861 RepID=UPI001FFF86F6|nr:FUSC family protein [Gordonia sp. PP30]UQE75342.1 FUSC family protein [Gordonia sp. PP30]